MTLMIEEIQCNEHKLAAKSVVWSDVAMEANYTVEKDGNYVSFSQSSLEYNLSRVITNETS